MRLSDPTTYIWMKIDQQRRCSPVTIVFDNISFMPIFAEVPWRGRQTTAEWSKAAIFSAFGHYFFRIVKDMAKVIIRHYIVSRWLSTDPKRVILHDQLTFVTIGDLRLWTFWIFCWRIALFFYLVTYFAALYCQVKLSRTQAYYLNVNIN